MFLGYAGLGILAGLFVKTFVTETKGRSLEEIEADLQAAAGSGNRGVAVHDSPPSHARLRAALRRTRWSGARLRLGRSLLIHVRG